MLRSFDIAQDRYKLLAIFLIGFWLLIPFNFSQADSDFLDGIEQQEPLESDALTGSDDHRAKRQFLLQAQSVCHGLQSDRGVNAVVAWPPRISI